MQVLLDQYPSIQEVRLWNYRRSSAVHLAEEVLGWLSDGTRSLKVCDNVADCVHDADLVVVATFAKKPVLRANDGLRQFGVHVMAVGAARPNLSEIDPAIWNQAVVFVDSLAGAKRESGDIIYSKCHIKSELGSYIAEKATPRAFAGGERTMFKSLGLAIQDLIAAKMVCDKVGDNDKSVELKFRPPAGFQGTGIRALKSVKTGVSNLDCRSKLVTDDVLVCELKTSSASLSMIYKAHTGQLKTILDGNHLANVSDEDRNALYVQAYKEFDNGSKL